MTKFLHLRPYRRWLRWRGFRIYTRPEIPGTWLSFRAAGWQGRLPDPADAFTESGWVLTES